MKFKKLKILLGISLLALGGCSNKGGVKTDNIKIGVLQYAEHNALTSAREGFVEALAEEGYTSDKVTFNVQNAMGDQSNLQTIAEQLARKNDLNFVIATPAAQAMVNVDDRTPTIFTAVTDPVAASLLVKTDAPEGNVTGTVDLTPVDKQIEKLLKIVPKAKKVGIFYNSSEVNSEAQAKIAKETLKKSGIEVVEKTVTTTNDVQQVITSLASEVDAIYFPTDTTVASTISTIGANAPYIGLLGTVIGILLTFYELGHAGGEIDAASIMVHLSLALKATAAGILVAIPAMMFYSGFNRKVDENKLRWQALHARKAA